MKSRTRTSTVLAELAGRDFEFWAVSSVMTTVFTAEVRFEITIGSGLQLDRSSVHFSFGLSYHLVEGLIDERQGPSS